MKKEKKIKLTKRQKMIIMGCYAGLRYSETSQRPIPNGKRPMPNGKRPMPNGKRPMSNGRKNLKTLSTRSGADVPIGKMV